MIVDHYSMVSKSQDDKVSREKQQTAREKPSSTSDSGVQEESKLADNFRTVIITKQSDSKAPLIGLTDYLTKYQKEKHEQTMRLLKKQGGAKGPSLTQKEKLENIDDDQV